MAGGKVYETNLQKAPIFWHCFSTCIDRFHCSLFVFRLFFPTLRYIDSLREKFHCNVSKSNDFSTLKCTIPFSDCHHHYSSEHLSFVRWALSYNIFVPFLAAQISQHPSTDSLLLRLCVTVARGVKLRSDNLFTVNFCALLLLGCMSN